MYDFSPEAGEVTLLRVVRGQAVRVVQVIFCAKLSLRVKGSFSWQKEGEELYMKWFSMGCNMTFAFWLFSPLNHPRPSGSESRPSQRKTFLVISNSKNYKIKCVANIPERFQTPGVVVGGIAPFTVFAGFCADDTFCHPPFVTPWTLSWAYISEAVKVDTRAA